MSTAMRVRALVPIFGSNRMLAGHVAAALQGYSWVGIPFVGGFSEVPLIAARTVLCNDLHRHIINLARVVRDNRLRAQMIRSLQRRVFHPDELEAAQERCAARQPGNEPDLELATDYFVCCWMGRSGKAGLVDEFNGRPATRWTSDGGDSAVRYRSALRSLASWGKTLQRCTFETMDGFEFLARCEDRRSHAIYADPPFVGAGRRYRHNPGQTDADEVAWHTRLRDCLERFEKAGVVCRFYDHPLIQQLYNRGRWEWKPLVGRKQTNQNAAEVLLTNGRLVSGGLFD